MASLRKASSYSRKRVRPYTRKSSKKSKSYIKAVPQNKIVKFHMGDIRGYNEGKYDYIVRLISEEKVQIRDNSLESCRLLVNKILDTQAPGQFYFAVKVFPHHILRENKSAGGVAGADRLSHGMKHSFGVTIGRAAIVPPGHDLFFVACANEKTARIAREALTKIKPKVPGKNKIIFEKIEKIAAQ